MNLESLDITDIRWKLEEMLESVYIEGDMEEQYFLSLIWDAALDQKGIDDIYRRLNERRVPVRDQYAPSQKSLGRWLNTFCRPIANNNKEQ